MLTTSCDSNEGVQLLPTMEKTIFQFTGFGVYFQHLCILYVAHGLCKAISQCPEAFFLTKLTLSGICLMFFFLNEHYFAFVIRLRCLTIKRILDVF